LQSRLEEIQATGTEVLAISSDPSPGTQESLGQAGIEFHLLGDPNLNAIKSYGVLHPGNGIGGTDIARPATFLIDEQGRVIWRELTDNWRIRLNPQKLIDQLAISP